jgi:hypothetical protein
VHLVRRCPWALLALAACAGASPPKPEAAIGSSGTPQTGVLEYSFDSLDAHPLSSAAMRGKPTVVAFISTYDLESQAQVDYLATMAKHDGDRVNYAMVALEPPENRELVEAFRRFVAEKFGVTLLTALGDPATIAGGGPFGDVHVVPTVVILDREGKVAWRKTGLGKSDEIRTVLSPL